MLYIVNALLPNNRAHGIQIANTCAGMVQAGLDVDLCTPAVWGQNVNGDLFAFYNLPRSYRHVKLPVADIPGSSLGFYLRSLCYYVLINFYVLCRLLQSYFKKQKLVIYVRAEAVFALYFISFLCPFFFETHQIRNYPFLYKRALKRVRGIVVITNNLKQKFVGEYALPARKIQVARDAVDLQKFASLHSDRSNLYEKNSIPVGKKLVIYCGSLSAEKGVYVLADAARLLSSDFHVLFVGGYGESLELFRKQYEGAKNITCVGQVPHEEVPRYIAAAHVVIQPDLASDVYASQFTSPMKLFEYMASGRPIIASDVPSLREVLSDQSALFFKPGDSAALASVINESAKNLPSITALARQAKADVSQFTWEKRGQLIRELIHAML